MIIGFVGTPGSGKSYEAVKKIIDNIKLGRKVYTNVEGLDQPRNRRYISDLCNINDFQIETCLNFLTEEQAVYPEQHCEPGSLVVIDEVHKLLSNRNWQSDENKSFAEWASTHRHDGYDLVLITQSLEKVDKHIRSLIEWTYFYRKMNMFGAAFQKKYIVYTYPEDDHTGRPLTKSIKTYDKRIFPAYQSYSNEAVSEIGFMKHTNMLKHPVFISIPIMFGIMIYFLSGSTLISGDILGEEARARNAAAITEVEKKDPDKEKNSSVRVAAIPAPAKTSFSINQDSDTPTRGSNIVKVYKRNDGKLVFTNTGQPQNTRFVRFM